MALNCPEHFIYKDLINVLFSLSPNLIPARNQCDPSSIILSLCGGSGVNLTQPCWAILRIGIVFKLLALNIYYYV